MSDCLVIDFSKHLDGLGKIGLEIPAHDVQEFDQDGVSKRVENLVSVFSVHHELPAAQNRQVLREVRLFDSQPFLNGAAGKLPVSQDLDDGDTGRMRERLKDTRFVRP